jgi:SAM-dependent methyltransferase
MHPYRIGERVYTGYHKAHGIEQTYCISSSPDELVERHAHAFSAYMSGRPYWHVDDALRLLGPVGDVLDIACASGRFSFRLAHQGVARVRGVEIRAEQVAQCELLRRADRRLEGLALSFEHVAVSADDPDFLAGDEHDVVLSMGLLYHLTNPLEHLRNLARLARRAALVYTLTHRQMRGGWELQREDARFVTKATGGVSWIPHFADLPDLLRDAGFSRVDVLVHPLEARFQERLRRELERDRWPRLAREIDHVLRQRLEERRLPELLRRGRNPRYFAYLAWK